MFTRKVKVELSLESRASIDKLGEDLLALVGMIEDLVKTHREVIRAINDEIDVQVSESGIEVFADETQEPRQRRGRSSPTLKPKVPLPPQLATPDTRLPTTGGHPKNTPFTRAPRSVQVIWLLDVLKAENGWLAPTTVARAYATDEYHYSYLRRVISRRLGEMFEDHQEGLERRSSDVKGSLFEFRLVK